MRNIQLINENWLFSKQAEAAPSALPTDWEAVTLPHTWNGEDGQDGGNDYHRGKCWYATTVRREQLTGAVNYLQFDGVNASAEVFWNGEKVAEHDGGYSTFRVKLENLQDENLLVVSADNSVNDRIYPQNADFTFYGGIYRDVKIVAVEETHFELDYIGTPGIKVTPVMDGTTARVTVETWQNGGEVAVTVNGETQTAASVDGTAKFEFVIENAHLWNGRKDPFLYTAKAVLLVDGAEVDEIGTRFGCRSFAIDPEKGFILNGEAYPLRGVSRHQDRPQIGNALSYEHHKEDIDLILEMGATTIRLAHYQHSQTFYDLCDEAGLVIWAEIPYITVHMPGGRANTMSQMTELIVQNYNHPSIVVWGLSNEITGGCTPKDKDLLDNHRQLNDLVHKLDATRPTTMACITMCGMDEEIVHISDVVSYNHYFGWYGGNVDMNGPWFDNFHKKYPGRAIGISEYGAEALNWHTSEPAQGDYTEEYQAYYHEEMIKVIAHRPYLWATHCWNMFDFAADARCEGGKSGMNHKGLITFDRKYKKDAFFAYKAWLSDEPVLHLCGKRYINRAEDVTKVTVYSNLPEVELYANGELVGKQTKGEFPFFYFDVKNVGETTLVAKAGELTDESKLVKVEVFDESYRMKEDGVIINWFEITTRDGYCCINDTIEDIMNTLRGKWVLAAFIVALILKKKKADAANDAAKAEQKEGHGMNMQLDYKALMQMIKGFTVKRMINMLGMAGIPTCTKEEILALNAKLNKCKKIKK